MMDEKKPPAAERLLPILGRPGVEPLLDSHAAAALLGVHPRTLQRMVLRGEMPGCMSASYGGSGLPRLTNGSSAN